MGMNTPRIHHLNTGTMCPASARLVNGRGRLFERARMVCHVLLVETERDGLVLVDTGLGTGDIADPARLGRFWVRTSRPRLDLDETAIAQVRALGHSPDDVRHIAVTHLDLDHAGGVPDFPRAAVHVHRREHAMAMERPGKRERWRYIPGHWQHEPRWQLHDDGGDEWFGFAGVRPLLRDPDILMVPLPGHTAGHSGIAVKDGDRWLLHAGDAYFFHRQIDTPPAAPLVLRLFQRRSDTDRAQRLANQERLRRLKAEHGREVVIFNAHDPVDFDRAAGSTGAAAAPAAGAGATYTGVSQSA
jgi:glyoxylase-like metal-dependent hydrolase (beta-lactamase superfamily II)